jgi:hypothetical protein
MRIATLVLALLALAVVPATVHRRSLPNQSAYHVAIVQIPDGASIQNGASAAIAELGTVVGGRRATVSGVRIRRRPHSYVVSTLVGMRATSSTGNSGLVSLQAFLDAALPGVVVKIDGLTVTAYPQVFTTHVPLGIVTSHVIEITIPDRLNPALVPSEILLEFGATT